MQPLGLSEPEIDDVVAFLASLTSSQYQDQGERELERTTLALAHKSAAARFGPGVWSEADSAEAVP
jgi:cytochrome c peroxidase